MIPCPFCDAPLKPSATFCLACDRPVVPETSRLSVGEPVEVKMGRPLVAVAVAVGVLLALGGTAYGAVAFLHHQSADSRAAAVHDIAHGTTLLLEAEGGDAAACRATVRVLAGQPAATRQACAGVVDHDPGIKVDKVVVDRLHLGGTTGTARVRATITDDKGTRTVDRVVDLVRQARSWRLNWNGRATV